MRAAALVALGLALGSEAALPVFDSVQKLPYDEAGHLGSHWILFPEKCTAENGEMIRFLNSQPSLLAERGVGLAGESLAKELQMEHCGEAISLERGTPAESIPFWNQHFIPEEAKTTFSQWYDTNCLSAEIGFLSYHQHDIDVKWVQEGTGQLFDQGILRYGEKHTMWRTSRLGHVFKLFDLSTGELVGEYKVKYNGIYVIGDYVLKPLTQAEIDEKNKAVEKTLKFEFERSRSIQRTFTERGFDKARLHDLDPFVWGSIRAYYYNNRPHGSAREEWDRKGLYVNWWESEPRVIQMPWQLKTMWHNRLMRVVEDWIGGIPLERSDIYGIRIYKKGARLLSHVDRIETHAASMILNVDQVNVTTPWPVEIYDHSDHLHELTMDPGNVVYYESARCLHARMNPLREGEYANIFIHYRPASGAAWYREQNPPGTPTPVTTQTHVSPFLERTPEPSRLPTLECNPSRELRQLLDKKRRSPKQEDRLRQLLSDEACVRIEADGTKIHLDRLADHTELFAWWNRWKLREGEVHSEL